MEKALFLTRDCEAPEIISWGDAKRIAALRAFDILDTGPEAAFDEITQLARDACHTPVALVSFLEAERQWFKSEIGLGLRETSLDSSICAQTIHLSELVVINDTAEDSRLRDNPLVTGKQLRFYAGARLETSDGLLLGAVCVLDFQPRPDGLTEKQSKTLLALARAVMRELELRRANKALAQNTALMNATLEHVDQGILMVDESGAVVICNQRAMDLLGLPPDMMHSAPRFDEVKQWQLEQGEFAEADPMLLRAIKHEGVNIEASIYERQRPNGTVLEVRTNRLPNGGVVRTFTDVTARKAAEEAAANSEARYRSLCDALPQKVLVTTTDGTITYQNRQFGDYHGAIGTGLDERLRLNHPDDAPAILRSRAQAIALAQPVQGEGRLQRHDGAYRWHHLTLNPITRGGAVAEWVATSLDIDELRQTQSKLRGSEERYRALVEASSVVVWCASPDGAITEVWGQGIDGGRVDGEDGSSALGWLADIHPEDHDRVVANWRERLVVPEPFTKEYRVRCLDGRYRWFSSRGVPLKDSNGAVREWVGTITDIDSRKLSEERLRESEERYRLAAHAASDAIWEWDLASNRLRWGESVERIFAYDAAQVPASSTAWLNYIHPDDRAAVESKLERFIADAGERWEDEYRLKRGDGSYAFVADRGFLVRDEAGVPVRMVGAVQDLSEQRRSNVALRTSEERLRLALAATGLGIWDIDLVIGNREWSPEVHHILGLAETARAGRSSFLPLLHPDDRERITAEFYPAFDVGAASISETFRIIRANDGETRWVEVGGRTFYDTDGRPVRMLGTIQDITTRKIAEEALRSGGERLRLALHASNMVAWDLDVTTSWVDRSDTAHALLGFGSGPAADFLDRVHPEDQHKVIQLRNAAIAEGTHAAEIRYRGPGDREVWLALRAERKDQHRLIGITFDISDRKATEAAIWQTANHDPLTGLPNRALFQTRLEEALRTAEADGSGVGLLLLDLDDFKDINDTLGHAAGDKLLAETARRLIGLIGEHDTVSRLGGDEFAIILAKPTGLLDLAVFANSLVEALRTTFEFEGRALSTKASIGVAAYPEHHRDPAELMKDADIALYRAKEGRRSRAVVYTSAAREVMEHRVTILREVRSGMAAAEFLPHYQPKVSLATGQIVGFEALARWRHPTKGLLTPAYFGSAFEDQDISATLATDIVRQVVADIRSWLDQGLNCGRIAVNLASTDFADRALATRIIDILDDARVPTSQFEVEVTETVFLGRKTEAAAYILSEFHEAGVSVALDDFGTGFASLTHLKQFPVDHIKIDQSFVRNLETDDDDAAIVAAVVNLGRNMGMHITAEGVENAGQVKRLREAGCDFGQGYLYAKPSPASEVPGIIQNWTPPEELGLRQSLKRLIRQS